MTRILYIDIDTLRSDHLGCYGYHRNTSPAIDSIAADGLRFQNVYVSDSPCLPSRSALITGQFGIHNGAINHGGRRSELWPAAPDRGFTSDLLNTSFASCLGQAGLRTTTISSFAPRHSAYHWLTGFDEALNPGGGGMEDADDVGPLALDWIVRNGAADNWFCHVHLWDPHTPYRAPASYGEPFEDDPIPAWYTEELWQQHRLTAHGPHSTFETMGFDAEPAYLGGADKYPRQPRSIGSMDDARRMFDGYDTGIRYADDCVAAMLDALEGEGVLDDTVIIVTSDHGETLGELGVYADHQTADEYTNHVPMIIRWPGLTAGSSVDTGFHYQIDVAASIVELVGGEVPERWDGRSFAADLRANTTARSRQELILSHAAWTCQRSVRWSNHLLIQTFHDGFHLFPDIQLFDLDADPHELNDIAASEPALVADGQARYGKWLAAALDGAPHPDPMDEVLHEGGPFHIRNELAGYLLRLRETGRADFAERLIDTHGGSL